MLIVILTVSVVAKMADTLPTAKVEGEVEESRSYPFVKRSKWHARPPVESSLLPVPAPYVVIHHSFIPPMCTNLAECAYAMRTMQSMHVDQNKWWDVGYNFGIGSDGAVYEGRGWTTLGAHAKGFNTVSIGICLIGNWNDILPPERQLQATHALIADGVALGYLTADYKVVGHRQVRATECPGQALFDHIRHWDRFDHIRHWDRFDPTMNITMAGLFVENNSNKVKPIVNNE